MAKQAWKFEPTARWIRVQFNGEFIADSRNAMLMIESPYELVYYFPESDVRTEFLEVSEYTRHSNYRGEQVFWNVRVGDKLAENAAWTYKSHANRPELEGYIAFDWSAMDAWYEEDEQVIGHPRNPYHRVDVIKSSRHIRIELDGVVLAESDRPYLLFETGFPTRYYLPKEDVNMQYLIPTDKQSICPYKGVASEYYTINVNGREYANLVWSYPEPFPEASRIQGLVAFYNEKVNIIVDGEPEEQPRTVFA